MEKDTKVKVKLSLQDAVKLGISGAIDSECVIHSEYTNGVDGYFVQQGKRIMGIASKYNAITPI